MKIIKSIVLATLIASPSYGKIGYTLEECRAAYGPEKKTESAWCGGTAYGFTTKELYIYAIIPAGESKVADITYFDNVTGNPLSESKKEGLWLLNQSSRWDFGNDFNWAGKNVRKVYDGGLGVERGYPHTVQFSRDMKYCNVANDKPVTGGLPVEPRGYQVRTMKEFKSQQKFIKKNFLTKDKIKKLQHEALKEADKIAKARS